MIKTSLSLAIALFTAAPSALAAAPGRVTCTVTENGNAAQGMIRVEKDGAEVAKGACDGQAVTVPAGTYQVRLQLDGVLDGPEQRQELTVKAGEAIGAQADFATGTLEVRIERKGRRAAGMAIIRRDGKQVGTLGGGVAAHLSAGTYEVVVRYRDAEQRFASVTVEAGKPAVLEATFE